MYRIELDNVLPDVFAGRENLVSGVWRKKLELEKGKSYLIEAASGTGKSSLCSFIYGYRKDYEGTIRFDDTDVRSLSGDRWTDVRQRNLGMMFQELRLFPELTAGENVILKNNLTHFRDEEQIRSWFSMLGIDDKWAEPVGRMSFGQQQRVAFVRMLCQPSDFLFMDEPVSHLDDANGSVMAKILDSEIRERGVGVVVTSIGRRLDMNYDAEIKL
ncbi:ATP-binding cassette domain-containing protein [uncultured Bacteroides sp.]|uniref:ATP-binding cassette domain-containing protein n=1 Tax=uncultured Bacteroides sp. TaxID=162156 RepID=UPI0026335F60|nr:ATP-binding cassette domain-containing protein [uncultured Bacteroides sp.]